MIKIISIENLLPGMYVTRITQPQQRIKVTSTGLVKTATAIKALQDRGITELEIDLAKSIHTVQESDPPSLPLSDQVLTTFGQQVEQTLELYEQTKSIHSKIIQRINKNRYANIADVHDLTNKIIDNVFESEEATRVVTQIRQVDEYLIEHSVNCSILMALFARYLNFDQQSIHQLAVGALLMDIGMAKVPLLVVQKRGALSAKETRQMEGHVDFAADVAEQSGCMSQVSIDVITHHHERLDGSGYPDGLIGEHVSVYARMAAIVDTYDSLTAKRPYRDAMTPAAALSFMMENEKQKMDVELMEKFAKCINLYPVGSVVKLQSGKLAMVLRANQYPPSSPMVMSFYDIQKNCHESIQQIDLSQSEDAIVSSILPEDFNLNMLDFFKQALVNHA
ncbi:HD-GYP domain-containing protein [Neptunicella sp.]|uniref:HD-GYP domain-containing protein n=1 Tax=Neptunicella sp. TaxID=2125986 RepID=UPI003F68BD37